MIVRENSLLLVIDLQEKLAPHIFDTEPLSSRVLALLTASQTLAIPVVFTEQYPSGLGRTTPELLQASPSPIIFEKVHFDATRQPGFPELMASFSRSEIVVTGTEAHVCVLQTALGLIKHGYNVHVCADAVGSRDVYDKQIALQRLGHQGANLITSEMALFEWLVRADTDEFRAVLPLVRDARKSR